MVIKLSFVLSVVSLSLSALTVEVPISIETNLPSYDRERGNGTDCIIYPLSRSGMNTFAQVPLSLDNAVTAYYSAISYLRYDVHPILHGQLKVSAEPLIPIKTSFDKRPEPMLEILGMRISSMKVNASAFEVRNRISTNVLSCVLLSFVDHGQYVFSIYYVENNGKSNISFKEAAQNYDLLGDESDCPVLTEEQSKRHIRVLKEYNSHHFLNNIPKLVPPCTTTNEVEVMTGDL